MRCACCDGWAVPQAVGLDAEGKVHFGYCLSCLVAADCRLVEVPTVGIHDLRLDFGAKETPSPQPVTEPARSLSSDSMQRYPVLIASMMIGWGLVLLVAGIWTGFRDAANPTSRGPGMSLSLSLGGVIAALLGLLTLILTARRIGLSESTRASGVMQLSALSWLSLLLATGLLLIGSLGSGPHGLLALGPAAGAAFFTAISARLLSRLLSRGNSKAPVTLAWKPAVTLPRSGAKATRRFP